MTLKVVNTYHLSYPDLDELGAALLAVLTIGELDDYSVYTAIVKLNCNDPNYYEQRRIAAHEVAQRGNKEHYRRAITFFPGISADNYRP